VKDADSGAGVLVAGSRGQQGDDGSREFFDGAAMRAWIERSHAALAAFRDELDALNVFPVPDSDTGTNLYLTMSEGRAALADLPPDAPLGDVAQAVAHGALMGARGNSGIILSQYLRAVGETFADQSEVEGGLWAWALDRAAISAADAMAEPVEGTALTVVSAASDAARRASFLARGTDATPVGVVVRAAAEASHAALARTPSLLAPLAERGVVDAGGAGFVLLLQALSDTVTGSRVDVPLVLTAPGGARVPSDVRPSALGEDCIADAHGHEHGLEHFQAGDYEVMYVLSASEDGADDLRARLGQIGASVGVVGGVAPGQARGLWHVHVHTDDPVLAVAAARGARIRQVCVRYLRGERPAPDALGLVACTRAPGLIAPLAAAGAVVVFVDAGDPGVRAGIARAAVDSGRRRVGILPCGPRTAAAAEEVVATFAAAGSDLRIEVLGSRGEAAVVAGVAGLAGAGSAPEAAALVSAGVARTRTGLVAWPGATGAAPDVARLTDIAAARLVDAAVAGVRDLVRPQDEVLTVVTGRGVPRDVVDALCVAATEVAPDIEVIELEGGQVSPAFALGVE
jgi:dihydroxyacetone kinase-like predicted kinase